MIGEILILSAVAAGSAYALDSNVRNSVNSAIASVTSKNSAPANTSNLYTNSGSGIGYSTLEQILNAISNLQQNNSPPPIQITYPSQILPTFQNNVTSPTGVTGNLKSLLASEGVPLTLGTTSSPISSSSSNSSPISSSSSNSSGGGGGSGSGGVILSSPIESSFVQLSNPIHTSSIPSSTSTLASQIASGQTYSPVMSNSNNLSSQISSGHFYSSIR